MLTPEPVKPTFSFKGNLLIDTSANVNTADPTSVSGLYRLSTSVSHNPSGVSAFSILDYGREYSYQRDDGTDGDLDSAVIGVKKTWKDPVAWLDMIALGLSSGLPVGRESVRRTFRGSLGPSLTLGKKLGRLEMSESVGYSYSFYEYGIRNDGTVNSPHGFRSISSLSLALTEKLVTSATFFYKRALSFQNVARDTTVTYLSLDYQLFTKLGVSVGVATEAGTLDPDGQTNRITFVDAGTSQAFFDLSMDF